MSETEWLVMMALIILGAAIGVPAVFYGVYWVLHALFVGVGVVTGWWTP